MRYTPRSELDDRVGRLQRLLAANDVECVLVRQNADLFYFSGTIQNAHLFIPAVGSPLLLVRRDFLRARIESQLDEVKPLGSLKQLPQLLGEHHIAHSSLGLELDVLPANQYLAYRDMFEGTRLVDASPLIRQVRAIKSPWEVARVEEAADQSDLIFRTIRDALREGVSEIEVAVEAEKAARLEGHQGQIRLRAWNSDVVFGQVVSGPNAATGSHLDATTGGVGVTPALGLGPGYRRIKRGEPVFIDVTGCAEGYLADQGRTLVIGPVPDAIRDAYQSMQSIYGELRAMLRPGVRACDVYERALDLAKQAGYEDFFMGTKAARFAFVGHGVGLELDELPPLARGVTTPLAEGMVIAVEPKVFMPGVGTIGFENSHLVTEQGVRTLTYADEELAAG